MRGSTARRWLVLLIAALALCSGMLAFALCSSGTTESAAPSSSEDPSSLMGLEVADAPVSETSPSAAASAASASAVADADSVDALAESKLASMTLEQKVAQMFIIRPESLTGEDVTLEAGEAMADALQGYPVGGFIYLGSNLEDADQTSGMLAETQRLSQDAIGLPMFLCVDEEGGTVLRIGDNPGFGIVGEGDMRAIGDAGDAERAYDAAYRTGSYLRDLGFTVDFAPVADVVNGESDTMALRSFGASADVVAPMVAAQVRGFDDAGMLCCAKHFPGIGGAEGDSHDDAIYSYKTLDELRQDELVPFQAAIEEGVPLIMVGHLDLPAAADDGLPASLSHEMVTDRLRNDLGFEGLIITDSLGMGAVYERFGPGDSAVMAVEAGEDLLLVPYDFYESYDRVLGAVRSGRISESRIDDSVRRILKAKLGFNDGFAHR